MSYTRQQVGRWGEAVAAYYLEKHGYRILARNARTRYGEIDLVAQHQTGGLVFVEVKTRTNASFGYPEEAVDGRKLEHLTASAEAYRLKLIEQHSELAELAWRIDVIAIEGRPGGKVEDVRIEHFQNITG